MSPEEDKRIEVLLKLYGMLTDQLHKNSTLLWQIPIALLVANAVALDKFKVPPLAILLLAVFDIAMAYACLRVRGTQTVVISTVREIEDELRNTEYKSFTPHFKDSIDPSAPDIVVWVLFTMSGALFIYGLWRLVAALN